MKILFLSLIILPYFFAISSGTIINIPVDYSTIQGGINSSSDGDTVLVQTGTYYENINFNGHEIVVGSLFLTTEDTSYIATTIIDGNLSDRVILFDHHEDSTAVICGFTIRRGKPSTGEGGGGIKCINNSNPTIRFNYIEGNIINDSFSQGGGIYCSGTSPIIVNNRISNNKTGYHDLQVAAGGGVYCENSNPRISDNVINNNSCEAITLASGGGIYITNSSNPEITNNLIINNTTEGRYTAGGGIRIINANDIVIEGNTIVHNTADGGGGGIHLISVGGVIGNNVIRNNLSDDGEGGGIQTVASTALISNNIIYRNSALLGGGIHCASSDPMILNNTIYHNMAEEGGGLSCIDSAYPQLVNSILWDNLPQEISFYELYDSNFIVIAFSDIQGGMEGIETNENGEIYWLDGNINENPVFIDQDAGDFNLLDGSPCINAGIQDTIFIYNNSHDTLSIPAIEYMGSAPEMGALEYEITGIFDGLTPQPANISLLQNYPNPFNPVTTIRYTLSHQSVVRLEIFNLIGQRLKTLQDNKQNAGQQCINWDASGFSSGIYFYRLTTGDKTFTKRMALIK